MRKFCLLLLAAVLCTPGSLLAQECNGGVRAVETVGFTVSDLDRSVAFFHDVLGFEKLREDELAGEQVERVSGVFGARIRVARLQLGSEQIELTQYLAPEGRPIPFGARGNDQSFQHIAIVVSDMQKAYATVRAHRVRFASTGPQKLPKSNPNAADIEAFYFRDPDGHFLELIYFPPGKGDARWQQKDKIFLGIDHTAIVSFDTERSLKFYRDALCMRVAGGSENFGPEQEHLNNVEGAHLRITALRSPAGPGIELLEYLDPHDGRKFPSDTESNDLWHWETTLDVPSVQQLTDRLPEAPRVSRTTTGNTLDPVIVRDPDGHALRLKSRP